MIDYSYKSLDEKIKTSVMNCIRVHGDLGAMYDEKEKRNNTADGIYKLYMPRNRREVGQLRNRWSSTKQDSISSNPRSEEDEE